MSKPAITEKAPNGKFPIGKVYGEPDLDTSEKINGVTATITPSGTGALATDGSVSIAADGKSFSWVIKDGVSGITYFIQWKVTTDGGKIFEHPSLYREGHKVIVT